MNTFQKRNCSNTKERLKSLEPYRFRKQVQPPSPFYKIHTGLPKRQLEQLDLGSRAH